MLYEFPMLNFPAKDLKQVSPHQEMHLLLRWLTQFLLVQLPLRSAQTLYESAVAFGMRKALQTEQGKNEMEGRIQTLETDVKDLERQVRACRGAAEWVMLTAQRVLTGDRQCMPWTKYKGWDGLCMSRLICHCGWLLLCRCKSGSSSVTQLRSVRTSAVRLRQRSTRRR